MLKRIDEAVSFIRSRSDLTPSVGIILGSGLGDFVDSMDCDVTIPYSEIPHAITSEVTGHAGRLVLGRVGDVPVAVMQGRIHYYEGHDIGDVIFLARVAGRLGIREAVVTNAAGGVNTSYRSGDLMLISDHINFMGVNPLRGMNIEELGPRFPDLTEIYPASLRGRAKRVAAPLGFELREGVYLALSGPNYETPAEIRAFRILGADVVGMSTVPEAIVYAHMGIPVLGISCVTNMAAGVLPQRLDHDEVLETTLRVRDQFIALLRGVLLDEQ
ncbi:MAG TPA: purine-nucleoside phosphorylase [Thermoanaerobaculia bacterium]|nr:purine-nucleoside phosphorylase [Thermoanaerobaculia bacterium]